MKINFNFLQFIDHPDIKKGTVSADSPFFILLD